MAKVTTLAISGLYTDPNPAVAPEGALAQAKNCVIRRPGICEPRLGFATTSSNPGGSSDRVRAMLAYNGYLFASLYDGGSWTMTSTQTGSSWNSVTGMSNPPDPTRIELRAAEARGNLYVTSDVGIKKLVGGSDTTGSAAGMPRGRLGTWATGTASGGNVDFLPAGSNVAYRILYVTRDANGVEVRGAPSPRLLCFNTSTTTAYYITLTLPLPSELAAGDLIEVYRSEVVAGNVGTATTGVAPGAPSDDMQLVQAYTITSTDVSNTYATISDGADIDRTSASLYTNEAQAGILGSHDRPPLSTEVCAYRGSLFFANTTGPYRLKVQLNNVGTNGINKRSTTLTAQANSGQADIALTSVTGLTVGCRVTESNTDPSIASTNVPIGATITAINSLTITISANLTGNITNGSTLYFYDQITVGGVQFYAGTTTDASKRMFKVETTYGANLNVLATARELVHVVNYCATAGVPAAFNLSVDSTGVADGFTQYGEMDFASPTAFELGGTTFNVLTRRNPQALGTVWNVADHSTGQILFEERAFGGSAFTIIGSQSTVWEPALPTSGSTLQAKRDVYVAELRCSSKDTPEHVPEVRNSTLVGDHASRILGMRATRDSLFIFKQDGAYRLTGLESGNGMADFQITPFDTTLKLLAPETLVVMDNEIYGWFNRGVCKVTDASVEVISQPIMESLRTIQAQLATYPASAKGAWGVAHESEGVYVLGVPSSTSATASNTAYVWNARVGAWTTWDLQKRSAVWNPADDKIYMGASGANTVQQQVRNFGTDWDHHDGVTTVTIDSISGNTVTLHASATVSAGDAIANSAGGNAAKATAASSGTTVTVDNGALLSTGSARLYTSYESIVEWLPQSNGSPLSRKMWARGSVNFEDLSSLYKFTLAFATDLATSFVDWSQTFTQVFTASPRTSGFTVPRNACQGSRIRPRLTIQQATAKWQLSGLMLESQEFEGVTLR